MRRCAADFWVTHDGLCAWAVPGAEKLYNTSVVASHEACFDQCHVFGKHRAPFLEPAVYDVDDELSEVSS